MNRYLARAGVVNHQTHHRGQIHALLTAMTGNAATPALDLIIYQRESGAAVSRKA